MGTVLVKALSLVFIILLAYVLKRIGLFSKTDYRIMVKVVLNVTLPASVIVSFASTTLDTGMLIVTVLGLLANAVMLVLGLAMSRRKSAPMRTLYALAAPGYNIGAFAMPFVQGFLAPIGVAGACLFDAGNAIMCTGGSYAITDTILNGRRDGGNPILAIGRKLCSSVPFLTYTAMLILSLAHLQVPAGIAGFLQPIANANPYCAMFMVGLMFELDFRPDILKAVGTLVAVRTLVSVALALGCYFWLPLPLAVRQALAIVVFAPPSILTPAFTERCGGDASTASYVTSLCIVTAIVGMIATLLLFQA